MGSSIVYCYVVSSHIYIQYKKQIKLARYALIDRCLTNQIYSKLVAWNDINVYLSALYVCTAK